MTIRIESNMTHPIQVRLTPPGYKPERFLTIPAATPATDGAPAKPGIAEVEEIDSLTYARLVHHYDWRPTDAKNNGKKREELQPDEIADIGLLRFSDVPGKRRRGEPTEAPGGASDKAA